jgi:hypothetical protein
MCLTMIDPATSWFKIVELPTVRVTVPKVGKGKKATCLDYTKDAEIFDKTSAQISNLVCKCWFSRYPCCCYMIYNNGSELKAYSTPLPLLVMLVSPPSLSHLLLHPCSLVPRQAHVCQPINQHTIVPASFVLVADCGTFLCFFLIAQSLE